MYGFIFIIPLISFCFCPSRISFLRLLYSFFALILLSLSYINWVLCLQLVHSLPPVGPTSVGPTTAVRHHNSLQKLQQEREKLRLRRQEIARTQGVRRLKKINMAEDAILFVIAVGYYLPEKDCFSFLALLIQEFDLYVYTTEALIIIDTLISDCLGQLVSSTNYF